MNKITNDMEIFKVGQKVIVKEFEMEITSVEIDEDGTVNYCNPNYSKWWNSDIDFKKTLKEIGAVGILRLKDGKEVSADGKNRIVFIKKYEFLNIAKEKQQGWVTGMDGLGYPVDFWEIIYQLPVETKTDTTETDKLKEEIESLKQDMQELREENVNLDKNYDDKIIECDKLRRETLELKTTISVLKLALKAVL